MRYSKRDPTSGKPGSVIFILENFLTFMEHLNELNKMKWKSKRNNQSPCKSAYHRSEFSILSNIYDGDFLQKQLTACNIKEEISELAFSSEFWKKKGRTPLQSTCGQLLLVLLFQFFGNQSHIFLNIIEKQKTVMCRGEWGTPVRQICHDGFLN